MNNSVIAVLDEAIQKAQFTLNWFTEDDVQNIKEVRITVERLAKAASVGSTMKLHANGNEGLWFGPEKTAELRAALAAFNGERL